MLEEKPQTGKRIVFRVVLSAHRVFFCWVKATCKLRPQGHSVIVILVTSTRQRVLESYHLGGVVRSGLVFVVRDAAVGQLCAARSLWQTSAGWFSSSSLMLLSLLVCLLILFPPLVSWDVCLHLIHACPERAAAPARDCGFMPRHQVVNRHSGRSPCQRLPGAAELTAGGFNILNCQADIHQSSRECAKQPG